MKIHHISSTIIILIFLGITYFANKPPDLKIIPKDSSIRPDFQLKNTQMTLFESGEKKWSLHAKDAKLYLHSSLAVLEDVESNIVTDGFSTLIKSPKATINTLKDEIVLQQVSGIIKNEESTILISTHELNWNPSKKIISGNKNVTISTEKTTLTAKQFLYDLPSQTISLLGSPKALFYLDKIRDNI